MEVESNQSRDNSNVTDVDQYLSDTLDLSNVSDSENQGLLLLRRLQELKVWQARQEAMLLEEQRQQISLKLSEVAAGNVEQQEQLADTEDDTTISSLESDQELHAESLPWYRTQQPLSAEQFHNLLELSGTQLSSLGQSPSPDRAEDQPLRGGGKTFAQLLTEQLTSKESEDIAPADQKRKVVTPKPFLKRGAGLARFSIPRDPASSDPSQEQKVPGTKQSIGRIVAPKYLNPRKQITSEPSSVPNQSPTSILKLKPSTSTSAQPRSQPRSQPPPRHTKFNLCDSVENSFCDKLSVQARRQEKDLRELAVFQQLEDAANDASFCSNSSKIKSLVSNAMLPSPNRKKNPNISTIKTSFASSTPASHLSQLSHSTPLVRHSGMSANGSSSLTQKDVDSLDPSLGESLMEDIRKFLQAKVANTETVPAYQASDDTEQQAGGENDSDWTDESDDSTLDGEEDQSSQSIGRNWQDHKTPTDTDNKENVGSGRVLEFSPPEKLPADPPSHLIWEIFGREREMRRRQQDQERMAAQMINKKVFESQSVKMNTATKPAPLSVRYENGSKPDTGPGVRHVAASMSSEADGNQDLTYQSTLLHMRVVELEQEIQTFKKENNKITNMKKKLQGDKNKLAKELTDFETLKETEKKKLEEDKRRLKRDKLLLEKGKKDQQKACNDCEERKKKLDMTNMELKAKEQKWTEEVNKLKEQLRKSSKDQQELENENQKLRLRKVSSKVGMVVGRETGPEVVVNSHRVEENSVFRNMSASLTSENQSSEEDRMDVEMRETLSNTIYNTLCQGDSTRQTPVVVSSPETVEEITDKEKGAREKRLSDGRLEVWYLNGNRKEVSADGSCVKIFYYNGDVKETHSHGLVRYLYSHTQTWHTTHTDGTEVLQFSNGQEETRLPDGSSSISFPDGSTKTISPGGQEKISFPDGTVVTVQPNGDRVLHLPNGQVEEHTSQHKKRTYPDGTVKILHMDGRQETRYAGGRVRVKDSQGVLVQDTASEVIDDRDELLKQPQ
eukprot:GFUD01117168.1.p1 GENE.GFUD01117168.1~~GFUD01117168.1.p1  ORF type:complete len:1013 (-),score=396.27 GFUD01117168.1:70-3108(-)